MVAGRALVPPVYERIERVAALGRRVIARVAAVQLAARSGACWEEAAGQGSRLAGDV